jgi:CheY-like chemotaxis protein
MHPDDPLWEHIQRIQETGERASKLTKQLLSFSRREIIEPRVMNLNELITNLSRMLQRIIGEDVSLVTNLAEGIWPIKVDPPQMEQVIVNLAVNARDAMPNGGRLSIETQNTVIDQAYVAQHVDVEPGEHVLLTISDTGVGMDDEVMAHLFEPFFTTKERGQGTGLGLPTAFGIIKQSGGHISAYSEVDQGTTFRIYLPHSTELEAESPVYVEPLGTARGTETILVVEDEPAVRDLAEQTLKTHGYHVLSAGSGAEALQISSLYTNPIHLLLTDVVMPQMNGRVLAEQLQAQRMETKVLYMSGYSSDVIAHHGVLQDGTVILLKPFTLETLTHKVRAVLDAS